MIQLPGEEKIFSFLDNQSGDVALLESGIKNKNLKMGMTKKKEFFIFHVALPASRPFSSSDLPVDNPPVLLLTHILQITPSIIATKSRMKERKKAVILN